MGEEEKDLPWTAAQRVEAWAGELRVNVIRLAAIVGFYGHHLFNVRVLKLDLPPKYTLFVTGIAAAWAAGALALHVTLAGHRALPALRYIVVGFDTLMATSLLLLSDGPRSPLVLLLFLVVATAPLRLDLRLVWAATGLALLSYLFLCGHAKWVRPEWSVPRQQQVIILLGLALAGFLAGQAVRQARRLARDYADRVRPEEAP